MTSSVGVSPGPVTRAPGVQRGWLRSRLDNTPGQLWLLLVGLVVLSLAWGVLAALTAEQHAAAAANVVSVSEPLSLDAEQIYQSLSDADATAATAFLSGGLEPAADLQRYNADITQAAIRIEAASALLGSSAARTQLPGHLNKQASTAGSATGDDLATLSAGLPVYTDEVGTAQADNRLGLPLGAAYLRVAAGQPADFGQRHLREGERAADLGQRPGHRTAAHGHRRGDRAGPRLPALPFVALADPAYP
jgi:hypothetical protein